MRKFFRLIPLLVFCACTSNQKPADADAGSVTVATDTVDLPSHAAPLPVVPDSLERPSQKIDYVMLHFWDDIDFTDPKVVADTLLIEQTFADFIELLPRSSSVEAAKDAIGSLYAKAAARSSAYQMMADVADKYLYTEDSPMRNRTLYSFFLKEIATNQNLKPEQRSRFAQQLAEMQQSAD